MTITGLENFDSTIQKSNIWLKEIMSEEGWDDKHKAYLVLRSVLHAIRDRLPVGEAAQLGSQLPMLLRGMYYEGWDPARSPLNIRTRDEFLALIELGYDRAQLDVDPVEALGAVIALLNHNISEEQMEDIRRSMPAEIQKIWPEKRLQ